MMKMSADILNWGAHAPRVPFDAPRVEHFAVRANELKYLSDVAVRLADGASASTREARVLPGNIL